MSCCASKEARRNKDNEFREKRVDVWEDVQGEHAILGKAMCDGDEGGNKQKESHIWSRRWLECHGLWEAARS